MERKKRNRKRVKKEKDETERERALDEYCKLRIKCEISSLTETCVPSKRAGYLYRGSGDQAQSMIKNLKNINTIRSFRSALEKSRIRTCLNPL